MMHWHARPQGWFDMEYADFLRARRPLISAVISEGFERLGTGEGSAT
jgi:hypothetical protein